MSRQTKGPDGTSPPHLVKSSGVVIAHAGYQGIGDLAQKDILLIQVDLPIPEREIMPPCFPTTVQAESLSVGSASYFKDATKPIPNGDTLWEQKECSIFGEIDNNPTDKKLWSTNCPALPGVSGSPIFTQNPKTKRLCTIGLIQGVSTASIQISQAQQNEGFNKMIPFSQITSKKRLNEIIDSIDCNKPIDRLKPPKKILI